MKAENHFTIGDNNDMDPYSGNVITGEIAPSARWGSALHNLDGTKLDPDKKVFSGLITQDGKGTIFSRNQNGAEFE